MSVTEEGIFIREKGIVATGGTCVLFLEPRLDTLRGEREEGGGIGVGNLTCEIYVGDTQLLYWWPGTLMEAPALQLLH